MKKVKVLNKKKKKISNIIAPLIGLVVIVAIWEISVAAFNIPRTILPSFTAIIKETARNFVVNIWPHALVTIRTASLGMLISVPVGIGLASIFSQFKVLNYGFTPIALALAVTPMITLVPLFMLWLGFDYEPRFIVVIVATVPIITLNTLSGFHEVPEKYLELMRGYGANKITVFKKVIFPNALPHVFNGVKLGCIFATIATTSIEMAAGNPGLGYRVTYFSSQIQTELVFGSIFGIALIGLALYSIVGFIEKRVVYWL